MVSGAWFVRTEPSGEGESQRSALVGTGFQCTVASAEQLVLDSALTVALVDFVRAQQVPVP